MEWNGVWSNFGKITNITRTKLKWRLEFCVHADFKLFMGYLMDGFRLLNSLFGFWFVKHAVIRSHMHLLNNS